jgi:opacity protein-like surface antigen
MKNILAVVCLVFACESLSSQTQQGTWELSLSGNLGSVSGSSETTGSFGSSKSELESQGYLSLALRPGFYIIDGLVVEPEILWTAVEKDPPSFSLSGNLAYNFSIPQSHITPFVLVGYGTGNAIPLFQRLLFRSSDKLDISVLNIGAGLKFFVAERIALRTEYRYQRYSQERTFSSGSFNSTTKTIQNFHNVFFGFSIFLP